jgi:hypothetical protein
LIDLYQELSDLTRPICATCDPPFKCCQGESGKTGCFRAGWWAKNVYGIELEKTDSYLTPTGCSVAPFLRPACAMHLCPDREKPPRYQELMAAIALAEAERFRALGQSKFAQTAMTVYKERHG